MEIVIIGQNEGESVSKMLSSLYSVKSSKLWVLDRCTDNSREQLIATDEQYICTPDNLKGRQTSFARNLGESETTEDVLFLDGDRYIVSGDLEGLETWDKDIALLLLEEDHRENLNFQESYGRVHSGFYSCGIFIKRVAIEKIKAYQQGELFRTDVQAEWGIEDVFLGDMCYHLGLTCDIYRDCRLKGGFENKNVGLRNMKKRFLLRNSLEVLWN